MNTNLFNTNFKTKSSLYQSISKFRPFSEFKKIYEKLSKDPNFDINTESNHDSLLTLALYCDYPGSDQISTFLIENGYNLNIKFGMDQLTAVHIAVNRDKFEILNLLVKKGADLNLRDSSTSTALHLALSNCKERAAEILIDGGIDLDNRDPDRKYSARLSYEELALNNSLTYIFILIWKKKKFDLNKRRENDERTPYLHHSISKKTYNSFDSHSIIISKFLIDKGADIELKDNEGCTPLYLCASNGNDTILKYLILKGANLNTPNEKGQTPLMAAVYNQMAENVSYLIDKGCDLYLKRPSGKTAFDYAKEYPSLTIQRMIENAHKQKTKLVLLWIRNQNSHPILNQNLPIDVFKHLISMLGNDFPGQSQHEDINLKRMKIE